MKNEEKTRKDSRVNARMAPKEGAAGDISERGEITGPPSCCGRRKSGAGSRTSRGARNASASWLGLPQYQSACAIRPAPGAASERASDGCRGASLGGLPSKTVRQWQFAAAQVMQFVLVALGDIGSGPLIDRLATFQSKRIGEFLSPTEVLDRVIFQHGSW